MDDEKSIPEKLTDAISKAAHSVKTAVSHIIDSASDAAQHAMEANAEKISRIPAAKSSPEQVAATTNEQIYIPEAGDGAAMPMPLVPLAAEPRKKRTPNPAAAKAAAKSKSSAGKKTTTTNQNKALKNAGKKSKRR